MLHYSISTCTAQGSIHPLSWSKLCRRPRAVRLSSLHHIRSQLTMHIPISSRKLQSSARSLGIEKETIQEEMVSGNLVFSADRPLTSSRKCAPLGSDVSVPSIMPSISLPPAHCMLLGCLLILLTFCLTSGSMDSSIKSLIGYAVSEKMSSLQARMPSSSQRE